MGRILIVEDEPDVLRVIKARIESVGHQAFTAMNGKQALEILKKEIPDLIITDVVMPEMDGFQLYKELKQNPATAKIPVLILTARGKMEDTFRVIGVDDFISKPYETEVFMAKVQKLLEHKPPPVAMPPVTLGTKILLSGSDPEVIAKMNTLLSDAGCRPEVAVAGPDIIAKSLSLWPKLIILDVTMIEIPCAEMIKLLRTMPGLEKVSIIVYSSLRNEAGEDLQQKILSIETAKENCLAAGATGQIGSFNERTFIKMVTPFI